MVAQKNIDDQFGRIAQLDRIAFWNPLPPGEGLDSETRRLVRDADQLIKSGRLESALDTSLLVNALAPEFLPGYVRTSELLVATSRRESAAQLIESISRFSELTGSDTYELELAKILAHLETDQDDTVRLARKILDETAGHLSKPYVPAAIDLLAARNQFDESFELAKSWVDQDGSDHYACAYLLREQLRQGDIDGANRTLMSFRQLPDADRRWPEHPVASAVIAVADRDDPRWAAVEPACQLIRERRVKRAAVVSLMNFLETAADDSHRFQIVSALFELNAGQFDGAADLLNTVRPESSIERYITSVGLARTIDAAQDGQSRQLALTDAVISIETPDDVELATQCQNLFNPSATLKDVALDLIYELRKSQAHSEALKVIEHLRSLEVRDPDFDRLHAEIVGQSGSRTEAIRTLDELLKRQEAERKHDAAARTLESMVKLLPTNAGLRNRLVETYLRTGKFELAIDRLVSFAQLLQKSGRADEAMTPFQRAVEIAGMVGDWSRVDSLHRMMIELDPESTLVRHSAVATYVQLGRTRDALTHLREIAQIARRKNDPDEAIAAFHQMLALSPDDASTYHQLGELLVSIHEYGQAERVYRRLETLTPDDPSVSAKRSALTAMEKNRA